MESIADLLGNYQGERIEVTTNAGQLMAGTVGEIYADYFAVLSATRVYFVPYTGISSFHFPPEPGSQQAEQLAAQKRSFVSRTPEKSRQKVVKRTKA